MKQCTVQKNESGIRIDKFLVKFLPRDISRSFLTKNIKEFVRVNDIQVKASYKVKEGDKLLIDDDQLSKKYEQEVQEGDLESNIIAQKGELDIVFENSDYIVLKKKAGVVVHPGVGNRENTLVNYVKQHLKVKGEYDLEIKRAGIVHRLDKPVGGLILFAKTRKFQKHIVSEFEKHNVLKIYFAKYQPLSKTDVCAKNGDIDYVNSLISQYLDEGVLDLSDWLKVSGVIKRDPGNRRRMVLQQGFQSKNSRYAESHVLFVGEEKALVLIKTGRMHQIRATFKSLGLVLIGDKLYGFKGKDSDSIGLNSVILGFKDLDGEKKIFNIMADLNAKK